MPTLWRIEVLHPMVVHFPIALLATGTLAWLVGRCVSEHGSWSFFVPAGRLALAAGTIGLWGAVYTGDLADAEVVRSLCDPTVVERHEEWAYWVGYLFTGALSVDIGLAHIEISDFSRRLASILVAIAFVTGSGLLVYVGHLGAKLVYEQGAAVHHPSEDCESFVD